MTGDYSSLIIEMVTLGISFLVIHKIFLFMVEIQVVSG